VSRRDELLVHILWGQPTRARQSVGQQNSICAFWSELYLICSGDVIIHRGNVENALCDHFPVIAIRTKLGSQVTTRNW